MLWHHVANADSERAAVAWGNNWVVIGIVVRLVFLLRSVCLPIMFRCWQPKRVCVQAVLFRALLLLPWVGN
ncbi:MAG: hypothetical protein ABSG43_29885 [Solirubrobacteraceae bacterium]